MNSPLYKLLGGTIDFSNEVELKAHLQDTLANIWDSLEASMINIGFPIESRLHQTHAKREWQEYIRRFTEGIYTLIAPAIKQNGGRLAIDISDAPSYEKIVESLKKHISNTKNGVPLPLGQDNSLEQASLNHVGTSLRILPKELRAYLSEAGVSTPTSSKHQIYKE